MLTISRVYLEGSDDSVSMNADTNLAVRGDDDVVYTTSGDSVWMVSGVDDTIAGSNFTIYASYGNKLTLSNGTQDTFVAAYNGIVTDLATGTLFRIGANVGSLQFVNFAADPTAVIDLLGGAGGYASPEAAAAAVVSGGSPGGSELPLGDNGMLLFDNRTPSQFTAANFKIG